MYDFLERLEWSKGTRLESDALTIMSMLDGCISVVEAPVELDKKGVDYIATLRRGAEVYIDIKTRTTGCSMYWGNVPEVAIELWSVRPSLGNKKKIGWTLDEAKITDMIFYVWDPEDTPEAYLIPFQSLRVAARRNIMKWLNTYKVDIQNSGSWESEAVFVPVDVVLDEVVNAMILPSPPLAGCSRPGSGGG